MPITTVVAEAGATPGSIWVEVNVMEELNEFSGGKDVVSEHDQVGTLEVQILLSWFFETADPADIEFEQPRLHEAA